jgi:beta-lactamase class A
VLAAGVVAGAGFLGTGSVNWSSDPAPDTTPASAPTANPTPTPPEPTPTTGTRTTPSIGDRARSTAAVEVEIAAHLASARAHAAVAVLDRVTGTALTVNGTTRFRTASIVKVNILVALMLQHQHDGTTLTKNQLDLARPMITMSDNAAASSLWWQIGAATGLAAANRIVGMTETTPGARGWWGATTTTAVDQVRLLVAITDPAGPLSAAHRRYLLDLMGHVTGAQDWGIPIAATPQTTAIQVKNGWMPFAGQRGEWTVNTIGRIVDPDHDWLASVLSDRNAGQRAGITTVESVARLAIFGLRTATATDATSPPGTPR